MIKMLFSSLMLVRCNAFIPILLTELNEDGTNDFQTYDLDKLDSTYEMPTVFINDFHATNSWAVARSLESVLETLIDESITRNKTEAKDYSNLPIKNDVTSQPTENFNDFFKHMDADIKNLHGFLRLQ